MMTLLCAKLNIGRQPENKNENIFLKMNLIIEFIVEV